MGSIELQLETDRYLDISAKVSDEGIDWAEARRIGTNAEEVFMLTYFSDIELQTTVYFRDLLSTKAALENDVIGFLSMWNYEEFYHGRILTRYLKECGYDLGRNRIAHVRKRANISEWLESLAASVLSFIYSDEFPAVHAAWGAVQEFTTLKAYETLGARTQNPALRTLCERIAKQERRHFAWYYNSAKERLEASHRAQKLTRFLLSRFWSPVGAGVKSDSEVSRMLHLLFREPGLARIASEIDAKVGALPGLDGISLMRAYMDRSGTPLELSHQS